MTIRPSPSQIETLSQPVRKVITSGFSFSGSSAINDLLLDNGAAAFPGGEMRIFSSARSFSALTRDIKHYGSIRADTIESVAALLRGNALGAKPHFVRSVRSSVARIRRSLGSFYDTRIETLVDELHRTPTQQAETIETCRRFIDDLCNHFARFNGVSVVVFDQGVRPWALSRVVFYGRPIVFVCRRDIRDQIIERSRHSLDNTGFEELLRSQANKFQAMLSKEQYREILVSVWFEDLVMDSSERRRILAAAGLGGRIRSGSYFNPIASRRNIGLYRARPELAPAPSPFHKGMLHPGTRWYRRILTWASDYLQYSDSARFNRAGAYSKTKDLQDILPPKGAAR